MAEDPHLAIVLGYGIGNVVRREAARVDGEARVDPSLGILYRLGVPGRIGDRAQGEVWGQMIEDPFRLIDPGQLREVSFRGEDVKTISLGRSPKPINDTRIVASRCPVLDKVKVLLPSFDEAGELLRELGRHELPVKEVLVHVLEDDRQEVRVAVSRRRKELQRALDARQDAGDGKLVEVLVGLDLVEEPLTLPQPACGGEGERKKPRHGSR